jgi:hypothetical protein
LINELFLNLTADYGCLGICSGLAFTETVHFHLNALGLSIQSDFGKSSFQVGNNIFNIFNADGQPEEIIHDAQPVGQ